MSTIRNVSSSIYSMLPSVRLSTPKEMLSKTMLLALPIIAFLGSEGFGRAEGGPIACIGCWPACLAATGGAFSAACVFICSAACAAPGA